MQRLKNALLGPHVGRTIDADESLHTITRPKLGASTEKLHASCIVLAERIAARHADRRLAEFDAARSCFGTLHLGATFNGLC